MTGGGPATRGSSVQARSEGQDAAKDGGGGQPVVRALPSGWSLQLRAAFGGFRGKGRVAGMLDWTGFLENERSAKHPGLLAC